MSNIQSAVRLTTNTTCEGDSVVQKVSAIRCGAGPCAHALEVGAQRGHSAADSKKVGDASWP
jgi:hypothetical protein